MFGLRTTEAETRAALQPLPKRKTLMQWFVFTTVVGLLMSGSLWITQAVLEGQDPQKLTVEVAPRVVPEGEQARVTCRVPRNEENRRLEFGLLGSNASSEDLDGEDAAITYRKWFRVVCQDDTAYCAVRKASGHVEVVKAPLVVSCQLKMPKKEKKP